MSERLPWGDMPYDSKTPAEVVHDYVKVRGDLSELYARDQLASWIERYADHRVESAEAERDAARREERMRAEDQAKAWRIIARVEALADAYEAWDGSDPHSEFSSSPRQRAQLRAALEGR